MNGKKDFFKNTAIMFIAMFIVKGLGAVLKIPLGNILGGEGMGYFTTAFNIFTPVLSFTCSGIPTIVTQATARFFSRSEYGEIAHFRRSALFLAVVSGLIGTALIYIAAMPFVTFIAGSPEGLLAVLLIAPSVFFCSVTAVYRGYYEGLSDMFPTAVSQVVESIVKAAAGLGLSYYTYGVCVHKFGNEEQALPYAAAAAILGVTFSEFSGMLYIAVRGRKDRKSLKKSCPKRDFNDVYKTAGEIFLKSLPISVGAIISNLLSFTDLLTISSCINLSYSLFPSQLAGGIAHITEADGINDIGNFLYGSYSGMVMSVYLLTATLPALIPHCSLPSLVCTAELDKDGNKLRITRRTALMIKATMLVSAPISMFMAVLSEPILRILYPVRLLEASAGIIPLQILSVGGIFASFECAVLSVFQAYGDFKTPVRVTFLCSLIKFILNITLIMIPGVNICGAAFATACSNLFGAGYSLLRLRKKFGLKILLSDSVFPPVIAASISAVTCFYGCKAFSTGLGEITSVIITCLAGAVLYLLILYIADGGELIKTIKSIGAPARRRR